MRPWLLVMFAVLLALVCTPSALAQKGCEPFYVPAGPEYGNFITGIWYAEGPAFLGHEQLYVNLLVQDLGYLALGEKGNTAKGTESAFYDFGKAGSFRTSISYVVEHNNDPDKFYMTAVETIIMGSGTGRFAGATGTFTDHGSFGISDWITMDGWSIFTTHGSICGVVPAE